MYYLCPDFETEEKPKGKLWNFLLVGVNESDWVRGGVE